MNNTKERNFAVDLTPLSDIIDFVEVIVQGIHVIWTNAYLDIQTLPKDIVLYRYVMEHDLNNYNLHIIPLSEVGYMPFGGTLLSFVPLRLNNCRYSMRKGDLKEVSNDFTSLSEYTKKHGDF